MTDTTEKTSESAEETEPKTAVVRGNSSIKAGSVFRTKKGCYRMFHSSAWGYYLMPVEDPDGIELSDYELHGIKLNKDFPKIPAHLWARWIALCFYMCPQSGTKMASSFHDQQLEVQVCLLRDQATLTKWKIVVPKQVVSGVSVKAELNENIDIATGQRYKQFPPEGWVHAGSSHSHNTMGAFFSSVDNKSELTCPGFHVVIGNIDHRSKEYTFASSIVMRKMRKNIDIDDVVDTEAMEKEFHKDVLEYIDTVVSANKKLYEAKSKPKASKKSGGPSLPWSDLANFKGKNGHFSLDDDEDEVTLDDIETLDDLDFFDLDEDKHFPYHDEVANIVDTALSQGYQMSDILLSLRRAKEDFDDFIQSSLEDDVDVTITLKNTTDKEKLW